MATAPALPEVEVHRTLTQICTPDGEPYAGYATQYLWVAESDPYAKTDGNHITPLLTGEAYFEMLAQEIAAATTSICMLGWQINWDVMLKPGLRLYDAIRNAVRKNAALKVYVLPWDDSAPIDTLDDETVAVMQSINREFQGAPRVFACLAGEHPDASAGMDMFYSHHQKQVIIDQRIAFMGGIDVAYGRRDTACYPLNATGRLGNDAYNGCVPHTLPVNKDDYVQGAQANGSEENPGRYGETAPNVLAQTARRHLSEGKVEYPLGDHLLDAARQPRMPWQDVHLRIEGPAVSDLASNFVLRWNVARGKAELPLPPPPDTYPKAGSCCVQMLRSASRVMVELEAKRVREADRARVHAHSGHNHIHHAMVRLIENAEHFIYIENQFFVSAFGEVGYGENKDGTHRSRVDPSAPVESVTGYVARKASRAVPGDADALPTNRICEALGAKLRDVILNADNPPPDGKRSAFHVYITLPVHPEGMLNDPSVMTQVHYTMQSLVYGSNSLLNRIRRAILARKLLEADDKDWTRALEADNTEFRQIKIEECWPYITLLNLRNWEQIGGHYVTEQIYVHTKLMVVDDRFAIVGSANINDRSQLGNRDSELAVLVMDTDFSHEDIGCPDGPTVVRKFARELRMGVWNKLLGNTGGIRPAGLQEAIKRPAAQESWEKIQELAADNTKAYEAVFPFIPRNKASIWPTITFDQGKRQAGLMPFDTAFWQAPQFRAAAVAQLNDIRGYITLLPWSWTQGENNNSRMHSALYVENTLPRPQTSQGFARLDPVSETEERAG